MRDRRAAANDAVPACRKGLPFSSSSIAAEIERRTRPTASPLPSATNSMLEDLRSKGFLGPPAPHAANPACLLDSFTNPGSKDPLPCAGTKASACSGEPEDGQAPPRALNTHAPEFVPSATCPPSFLGASDSGRRAQAFSPRRPVDSSTLPLRSKQPLAVAAPFGPSPGTRGYHLPASGTVSPPPYGYWPSTYDRWPCQQAPPLNRVPASIGRPSTFDEQLTALALVFPHEPRAAVAAALTALGSVVRAHAVFAALQDCMADLALPKVPAHLAGNPAAAALVKARGRLQQAIRPLTQQQRDSGCPEVRTSCLLLARLLSLPP